MMKIKESGWAGKSKVALALFVVVIISIVIMQCNSQMEESFSNELESAVITKVNTAVNVPLLPGTGGYGSIWDLSDAVNVTISGNKLSVNGVASKLAEIASQIERSGVTETGIIIMSIDGAQTMSFVRDVQWELRKANRRKLIYQGQVPVGEIANLPFILPPLPGSTFAKPLPVLNEKYVTENNIDLLKIDLGDNTGVENQKKVYDLVMSHIEKESSNYVVSMRYADDDTFNDYLVNLIYLLEGFNQIYEERAQEMFGKSFWEINESRFTNEESKKQHIAVRKGVPKNISVADG